MSDDEPRDDEQSPSHFRKARRQPVALRLRYRLEGATFEHPAVTNDLGLGGAFVETVDPPDVGARVVLVLDAASSWEPLEIPAEVRWTKDGAGGEPAGFGVRFGTLSGAQATALYELVHANAYPDPEPTE